MNSFRFSHEPLDVASLSAQLRDPACGGYASFEGWVRNHNEGQPVTRLEYEAFEPLAIKEAERIMAEAVQRFGIEHAACVHRIGDLAIGDLAVWVGASARHRHEAFLACRYIIDEVKHRVPIWKKEHYQNGNTGWVNCERCAAPGEHEAGTNEHSHGDLQSRQTDAAHGHSHSAHGHGHSHGAHAAGPVPDYSRQMALKEVGAAGQARLRSARVLVVGCGGLGVPVLSYLAGAGVGRLGLVDGDRLEASNLHRQTMYSLADVGRPKAELAAARLRALNPDVDLQVHTLRLNVDNAPELVAQFDLVIDCTDNFGTKFMLNDVCVRLGKPAVFSSVYQYEGQLQVIRPDRHGACLRCVWPEATRDGLVGNCSEAGVLGPVPGVFGSLQALEALKLLLDLPGQLGDELLVIDLTTLSVSRVRTRRAAPCQPGECKRIPAAAPEADPATLELDFDSLESARAQGFDVIDIREAREVAANPLSSAPARHTPMGVLLHGDTALDPAARYLLVCASGRRSLAAAQELRARGLSAFSLRGGVTALSHRSLS
jgi:molybdopterin/thiamine biosynthesis adenylyltransferase/molybdopterin synthase catalytic subunit/rhodanese-related sulfurtransferase